MRRLLIVPIVLAILAAGCGDGDAGDAGTITLYSGRSEALVAPLIEDFEAATGISVEVRYGDSAELAATILEEGTNSPADVFLAQDPASLGAVALGDLFTTLDGALLDRVPDRFRDVDGRWIGLSGRARVVVYDTTRLGADELPASEDDFVDPEWRGRVAIAPSNGSFLSFVAAKILLDGEDATRLWLEGIAANDPLTFPNNSSIVAAVDSGEAEVGLVNHYYLYRRIAEEGEVTAANYHPTAGGAGALVMPAGAGILATSDAPDLATEFIEFMLSQEAQEYFAAETHEYPLASGVAAGDELPPLDTINAPDLDLSRLAEVLDRATDLVADAGLL